MQNIVNMVEEFHRIYGLPHLKEPNLPELSRRNMRFDILEEEFKEYVKAESENDLVEIADALGDIIYVAIGTMLEYGIPAQKVMEEIQRANLSKLDADGKPIYREDGKILKGPNYSPPNIHAVLADS